MKVLIHIQWPVKAWSIPDAYVERLRTAFPDVTFARVFNLDDSAREIVDADVAFAPLIKAEMMTNARHLRWVHSPAAAVEGLLPLAELARAGVTVTNSKGVQAIPMAEHVMGGILALSRRFNRMFAAQMEHKWIQNDLVEDWPWVLHGQRMAIVGLGTIGVEIARRASAFGMRVTGIRRHPERPKPSFVDDVAGPSELNRALAGADVVVLSAPGVSATQRMIGAEQIGVLNRGALLVNVARAGIVDENAMRDALASGHLGGAVLDVFEREPLEAESPYWTMPNVIVTPHSSGFRKSHWDEVSHLFMENLRRFRAGDELVNVVDLNAGY